MDCHVCGIVDEFYEEEEQALHNSSAKHLCNVILYEYKEKKKYFSKNRDGVYIYAEAVSLNDDGSIAYKADKTDNYKIRIYVKPQQKVKFTFEVKNVMKNEDLSFIGVHAAHPQPQFTMNDHPYMFGREPYLLPKKTTLPGDVSVEFQATDIGQYEMPIMFTFHKDTIKRDMIFIREMVVMVEDDPIENSFGKSPYVNENWERADRIIRSTNTFPNPQKFKVPPLLKLLLPRGLSENTLQKLDKLSGEQKEEVRILLMETRQIFDEGLTKKNYMVYFHHLLWWEEIIGKINLRKYNMSAVTMLRKSNVYILEVPGLAEKRPSLLRNDRVFVRLHEDPKIVFEGVITNIEDSCIHIGEMAESFADVYGPDVLCDIRFITSRVPLERAHEAVSRVFLSKQDCRVFPEMKHMNIPLLAIPRFYNELIEHNAEQRSAVEHIVSGTSGKVPYIVFGPPGTGKTITIVEAIVQLVARNPVNRILVCTDSNMAADHIALTLLKYNKGLNKNKFLLRANSQSREWSVLPVELAKHSNGHSYDTWVSLSNRVLSSYRIVVTTLLHAAKYATARNQAVYKLQMSHLFIDEAAQASEPATLVPITGLLSPTGQLVLAGDPKQLGPVCVSRNAAELGLGVSLMERLLLSYANLYDKNPTYMTLLVKNFRSDPDILQIPNELFYQDELQALAKPDPLSKVSILGLPGGERAVVFHALHSREQKMGKAPSYFNEVELEMLKRYITTLITVHDVFPGDIGVIAPYIRQVYKVKAWLKEQQHDSIEVGTVEAFQGKEKRVILVSTVRANCRLLEYDAKYGLGFLVDDKRFNVAITRAKAKIVIIGNPACLIRDEKWRKYMCLCEQFESYHGKENQQLERTTALLVEIARTRFDKCRLTKALKAMDEENKKVKNSKKKK